MVTLAEELHFGRAAARHYITHGALSQQIARLERELGVQLFKRTSRRVALTEAGTLLVKRARGILAATASTLEEVRAYGGGLSGTLRLGLLGSGGGQIATEMMCAFCAAHPGARLQPSEMKTDGLIAPLLDGRLDVGLVWGPITDERLEVTPLFTEGRVAVLCPRNQRAAAESLAVSDLLDMRHGNQIPGEPDDWEGFWNLVPERSGTWPAKLAVSGSMTNCSRCRSRLPPTCPRTS